MLNGVPEKIQIDETFTFNVFEQSEITTVDDYDVTSNTSMREGETVGYDDYIKTNLLSQNHNFTFEMEETRALNASPTSSSAQKGKRFFRPRILSNKESTKKAKNKFHQEAITTGAATRVLQNDYLRDVTIHTANNTNIEYRESPVCQNDKQSYILTTKLQQPTKNSLSISANRSNKMNTLKIKSPLEVKTQKIKKKTGAKPRLSSLSVTSVFQSRPNRGASNQQKPANGVLPREDPSCSSSAEPKNSQQVRKLSPQRKVAPLILLKNGLDTDTFTLSILPPTALTSTPETIQLEDLRQKLQNKMAIPPTFFSSDTGGLKPQTNESQGFFIAAISAKNLPDLRVLIPHKSDNSEERTLRDARPVCPTLSTADASVSQPRSSDKENDCQNLAQYKSVSARLFVKEKEVSKVQTSDGSSTARRLCICTNSAKSCTPNDYRIMTNEECKSFFTTMYNSSETNNYNDGRIKLEEEPNSADVPVDSDVVDKPTRRSPLKGVDASKSKKICQARRKSSLQRTPSTSSTEAFHPKISVIRTNRDNGDASNRQILAKGLLLGKNESYSSSCEFQNPQVRELPAQSLKKSACLVSKTSSGQKTGLIPPNRTTLVTDLSPVNTRPDVLTHTKNVSRGRAVSAPGCSPDTPRTSEREDFSDRISSPYSSSAVTPKIELLTPKTENVSRAFAVKEEHLATLTDSVDVAPISQPRSTSTQPMTSSALFGVKAEVGGSGTTTGINAEFVNFDSVSKSDTPTDFTRSTISSASSDDQITANKNAGILLWKRFFERSDRRMKSKDPNIRNVISSDEIIPQMKDDGETGPPLKVEVPDAKKSNQERSLSASVLQSGRDCPNDNVNQTDIDRNVSNQRNGINSLEEDLSSSEFEFEDPHESLTGSYVDPARRVYPGACKKMTRKRNAQKGKVQMPSRPTTPSQVIPASKPQSSEKDFRGFSAEDLSYLNTPDLTSPNENGALDRLLRVVLERLPSESGRRESGSNCDDHRQISKLPRSLFPLKQTVDVSSYGRDSSMQNNTSDDRVDDGPDITSSTKNCTRKRVKHPPNARSVVVSTRLLRNARQSYQAMKKPIIKSAISKSVKKPRGKPKTISSGGGQASDKRTPSACMVVISSENIDNQLRLPEKSLEKDALFGNVSSKYTMQNNTRKSCVDDDGRNVTLSGPNCTRNSVKHATTAKKSRIESAIKGPRGRPRKYFSTGLKTSETNTPSACTVVISSKNIENHLFPDNSLRKHAKAAPNSSDVNNDDALIPLHRSRVTATTETPEQSREDDLVPTVRNDSFGLVKSVPASEEPDEDPIDFTAVSATLNSVERRRDVSCRKRQRVGDDGGSLVPRPIRMPVDGPRDALALPATTPEQKGAFLLNLSRNQIDFFMDGLKRQHHSEGVVKEALCAKLAVIFNAAARRRAFTSSMPPDVVFQAYSFLAEFINGAMYPHEEPETFIGSLGTAYVEEFGPIQ